MMTAPHTVTVLDALVELKREMAQRQLVYPKWIKDRKLTQANADRRLAALDKAIEIVGFCERHGAAFKAFLQAIDPQTGELR